MTILLYSLITITAVLTIARPWIGVIAYYVLALFYPQIIWPWIFYGIRVNFIISIITIVAFLKDLVFKGFNFSVLKSKQSILVLLLWLSIINSYLNNPYGPNNTDVIIYNSQYLFSIFNKIFLFYFISICLVKSKLHLHLLLIVLMGTVLYFTYYANMTHLSGQFHGRLPGPGVGGVYSDENVFAMIFIVAIPVFYFFGNYYKNWILKFGLWTAIPAAWHAIFLTGSMGGLLSLSVVMAFVALRSKKKIFIVAIPLLFILAFILQAGSYLKQKASQTGAGVEQVTSAQTRFESWGAGLKMISAHPVTGVGPGNFIRAYSDFSSTRPFVAHNTFVQLAAETGIISGLMYLLLGWSFLSSYFRQRKYDKEDFDPFLLATKESITGAAIGFYASATFLNLATYEILYFLLVAKTLQDKLTIEYILNKTNSQPEHLT